jgi:ABC-type molybdate transport system substrate-binding protein
MLIRLTILCVITAIIAFAPPTPPARAVDASIASGAPALPSFPSGKETDVKLYVPGSAIVTGRDAFERMSSAHLVLWLAGNQFFAMDGIIAAFQQINPTISVGLITLPPGLLLQAIQSGGWVYQGKQYREQPDIYASVNLGHLKTLKASGAMNSYMIYMHNELQIMVARGNPKQVTTIDDLGRTDVRTSMPNPVNEGIMQFYARKVLERHGLWNSISAGKECVSCQTTPNNWFTAVHHRETPERIKAGTSDAGLVWKTEVLEALRTGANVDAVELQPADSLRGEVSYVIGTLANTRHVSAANLYLQFLGSAEGQRAYAKYGFVEATDEERKPRPID